MVAYCANASFTDLGRHVGMFPGTLPSTPQVFATLKKRSRVICQGQEVCFTGTAHPLVPLLMSGLCWSLAQC